MNDETSPIALATLVASVLSLIGSSTILLSYVLYSRGVGISKMIMFLALSDLGWSIVEILAFSIIISDPSLYTLDICRAARGAFQFFSSAAVMWSMCIGFFLFRNVVQSNDPNTSDQNLETKKMKQPMIIYHLISWGIPILQCAIIFIPKKGGYVTPFKSQYICLPTEPFLGAAWFLPIFIAICLSASLYTMLLFIIYRKTKSTGTNVYHQIPFRLASYVLVLLLCWVPNIIAYLEIAIAKEYESTFMSIVNGLLELQGTLDCIVYGFTNREFRNNFTGLKAPFQIILSPVILPFAFIWAVYKWFVKTKTKSIYTPILDQNASGSNPRYNNTRLMRDL